MIQINNEEVIINNNINNNNGVVISPIEAANNKYFELLRVITTQELTSELIQNMNREEVQNIIDLIRGYSYAKLHNDKKSLREFKFLIIGQKKAGKSSFASLISSLDSKLDYVNLLPTVSDGIQNGTTNIGTLAIKNNYLEAGGDDLGDFHVTFTEFIGHSDENTVIQDNETASHMGALDYILYLTRKGVFQPNYIPTNLVGPDFPVCAAIKEATGDPHQCVLVIFKINPADFEFQDGNYVLKENNSQHNTIEILKELGRKGTKYVLLVNNYTDHPNLDATLVEKAICRGLISGCTTFLWSPIDMPLTNSTLITNQMKIATEVITYLLLSQSEIQSTAQAQTKTVVGKAVNTGINGVIDIAHIKISPKKILSDHYQLAIIFLLLSILIYKFDFNFKLNKM